MSSTGRANRRLASNDSMPALPFRAVGHLPFVAQNRRADDAPNRSNTMNARFTAGEANVSETPKHETPRLHPLSEVGHEKVDTRIARASLAPLSGRSAIRILLPRQVMPDDHSVSPDQGHPTPDDHHSCALIHPLREAGQFLSEAQSTRADLSPICNLLIELHRQRQDLHRAEKSLTLQIKAKCRRAVEGDKVIAEKLYAAMFSDKAEHDLSDALLMICEPFITARATLEKRRTETEKQMAREAKKLPVAAWVAQIRGFGIASLAAIVGETGDLSSYANPDKAKKRLGLAPFKGKAASTWRKSGGLVADDWKEVGYSPSRRSVMWNVGACVMKSQSESIDKETGEVLWPAGHYRAIYDTRKAREADRVETKLHAHNRALRYMEQRLVIDLWRAWHGMTAPVIREGEEGWGG